jgi:hypothetical protein
MTIRTRTSLAALAAVPVLLVALAACSGPAADAEPKTQKTATAQDWSLAWASCMRDAGHTVDDPTSDGGQGISLADGDSIESFTADSGTCDKKVTQKLGERPVSDEQKKQAQEDAKTDDCLRKEGVEVTDGGALNLDDIPADVQEKCGVVAPSGDSGRAGR